MSKQAQAPKATEQIKVMMTLDQAAWLREHGVTDSILTALEYLYDDFPTDRRAWGVRDEPEYTQNTWRDKLDNLEGK